MNVTLDNSANREACYRCHPGSTTKCLRGAMGGAIAADGSMEMQCQNCHGNMSAVGAANRTGWLEEPKCQSCHVGTANHTSTIRYTSVFTDPPSNSVQRAAVDQTFATVSNTPASGLSLYRFSAGHGGLQCEACHGSTHAEFPSTHLNDNLRNIQLQGHAGVMVECTACHTTTPANYAGGPHGMHPVGTNWVTLHPDFAENNSAQCQACHGTDDRGTVLSRMQADRTLSAFGTKTFFRGAIIGCYTCHSGPGSETANNSTPPTVSNASTSTTNDKSVAMTLSATGSGLTLRIISQPANGSVGLSGTVATYFPDPGFVGTNKFTFAAYDGSKNSNLATGTVAVAQGPFGISATAHVPPSYPVSWPVAFAVVPVVTNNSTPVTFAWNFGDGTASGTNQFPQHAYPVPGNYNWTVVSSVSTAKATNSGSILIGNPVMVGIAKAGSSLTLSWPNTIADMLLEGTPALGSSANWAPVTNAVSVGQNTLSVTVSPTGNKFFRVRQLW